MDTVIHVTGAGVVSAVGCGQGETLDALRRGRSGIAPVRYLRTEEKAFRSGKSSFPMRKWRNGAEPRWVCPGPP